MISEMSVIGDALRCYREEGIGTFVRKIIYCIAWYIRYFIKKIRLVIKDHFWILDVFLLFIEQTIKKQRILYVRKIYDCKGFCLNTSTPYKEVRNNKITDRAIPATYEACFEDVNIFGGTELICKDNKYFHEMIARDAEVKRAFLQDDTIIRHKDSNHIILSYKASDTVIEKGIYMLGVVSTNYYHFHVEIISRLPFIDGKEEYRGWPILIDKGVLEIPQMKEFLSVMNVYNHPVIGIDNNTCVHVGKLAFVSRNMWMPFNMKKNIQMQPGDVLISSSVVDNIRERIFSRPIQQGREKKIFLSRANTKNSRLENTAEIENIFRDNGFAVIMTEKLSYEEQVALFHGADMIAGVTGAAFTNMIYCRPGTRIGIIAGVEQRLDFFIKVADLVGARCRIIPAKITYHDAMSISRDKFKLEADVAKQFINNI